MNFSPETIAAAKEISLASHLAISLPTNTTRAKIRKAYARVHRAWVAGYDAGLSGDEMAVLNYASHPWCRTWVREYIAKGKR